MREDLLMAFFDFLCHYFLHQILDSPTTKKSKKIENKKNQKVIKSDGFDQNGGHHELRREKSWKLHLFMLIFEPRRPIS